MSEPCPVCIEEDFETDGLVVRRGGKAVAVTAATIEKVGRVRAIREAITLLDDPRTDIQ